MPYFLVCDSQSQRNAVVVFWLITGYGSAQSYVYFFLFRNDIYVV